MSDFGDLRVSGELTVPAWELSEAFVRASGPGGQNVNKVSSAVQLTWNVGASSLPPEAGSVRRRIASKKRRGEIKSLRGSVETDD